MKKFNVFSDSGNGYKAIRSGFNWPVFIFATLVSISNPVGLSDSGIFIALVPIIFVSYQLNGWRAYMLTTQNFEYMGSAVATTRRKAILLVRAQENNSNSSAPVMKKSFGIPKEIVTAKTVAEATFTRMQKLEGFTSLFLADNNQIVDTNSEREIIAFVYNIYRLSISLSKFSRAEVQLIMLALTPLTCMEYNRERGLGITIDFFTTEY